MFLNVWNLQNGKANLLSNCKKKVTGAPFMHKRWQWGVFCLLWAAIHSFMRSFHTCDFQWNDSWLVWSQSVAFDAIRDAPLSDQQVLCFMHYYHFWMNLGFKVGYSRQKVILFARWFAVCRRSLTFETLSCIAHGDASSLQFSDFDIWMKIKCVAGERWYHSRCSFMRLIVAVLRLFVRALRQATHCSRE